MLTAANHSLPRTLSPLCALLFLLVCLSGAQAQTGTITIQNRPGTFPTIQSAINAALPNDTILVDGGDHPENLLITIPLAVRGSNNAAINPTSGDVIRVVNPAGPVGVSGFTIKIPAGQIGVSYDGVPTDPLNTGTILNSKMIGGRIGVASQEAHMRVVGNQFSNFTTAAVQLQGNAGNTDRKLRVSLNTFTGKMVINGAVNTVSNAITLLNGNLQVDGNQMSNLATAVSASLSIGLASNNLLNNVVTGIEATDTTGFTIERNSFSATTAFLAAINAAQFNANGLRLVRSSGAILRNNSLLSGNLGIVLTQQSPNATIDANIVSGMVAGFQGGGVGIQIVLNSSAEVHNNNIEHNSLFGVQAFSSPLINASQNWWGSASGPGSGGANPVSAGVTVLPFLFFPNPNAGA